jgi:hypothetical protein
MKSSRHPVNSAGSKRAANPLRNTIRRTPSRTPRILAWLVTVSLCLPVTSLAQSFTGFDLPLPVASAGTAQWGDYDSDGDYDFVITGQPELRVYRNDGSGVFTSQGLSLVLRQSKAVVWGDWDNDNDLDLVVGGADTGGGPVQGVYSLACLYRNDGGSGFTLVGSGIPFIGYPTLADMDNDGDLDLVIAGETPNIGSGDSLTIRVIRVYSNEGDGSFQFQVEFPTPVNTFAARVVDLNADGRADLVHFQIADNSVLFTERLNHGSYQFGSNSWTVSPLGPGLLLQGDIDNDADEDFGILGYDNGPLPNYSGWLRNDGDTNVLLPGIVFPLFNTVCSLADYDNDGRIDVAETGGSTGSGNLFRLFHNDGNFASSPVDPGIEGTQFAVMAWGDSDLDGDLDLLLSGIPNPPSPGSPFIRLYRNDTTVTNLPPQPPTNLSSVVTGSGVTVNWLGATDPNQTGGLTYNLRVGRSPGGVDIVTPAANSVTGELLLPQPGNAGYRHSVSLTNLLAGTCYWSVQTVDQVFASSPFATEGSFVIPPGLPRVSAAAASDVRYQHATLTASAIPNGATALAWFEYGLSTNYDQTTPATPLGDGITPVFLTNEITSLLTATPYHFRVVASNSVGLAAGPDSVFFITNLIPAISGLTNLVLIPPNQSSPLVSFRVGDLESPADSLQLTGTALNATLLPAAGIEFGGAGSNRTVRLTPAANQRGITALTVRVTDEQGGQKSQNLAVRVEDFSPVWNMLSGAGEVVLGDINRDGFLDVVRNDRWLQNQQGTNLALPTGGTIQNPITGGLFLTDVDNDGDLDVTESGSINTTRLTSIWSNALPPPGQPWLRPAMVTNLQGYFSAAITWADWDQDGDNDLILAGHTNTATATNFKTRAYRNNGALMLTLVPGLFPDLADAAFGWADFDRDGDLDVCLTGSTNLSAVGYCTGLFSNDGSGQFSSVPTTLPAVTRGFVAWGDVDNDGWPDLFLSGLHRVGSVNTNITRLYRNGGNGSFSEYAAFDGVMFPRGLLSDLDNDGLLDVVFVGTTGGGFPQSVARIYLNQGAGQFRDIGPTLPSTFSPATLASSDLDRDGKPDVILGTQVYRNNFPTTNSPPTTPTNLNAIATADTVHLSWSAATDINQSGGHTYNLRVGTVPGQGNVMSPLAESVTGRRWTPAAGNASESLQWRLSNLPTGTYYWSVQTIDHAGGESPFAPEQSFLVEDPRPRILSLELTGSTLTLVAQFGWPGSYSLLTSSNLSSWYDLPPVDYSAGTTNLVLPIPGELNQFFRLRRN